MVHLLWAERIVMGYLKLYVLLSLMIGSIGTLIVLYKKRDLIHDERDDDLVRRKSLDKQVKKGHLQKVEFGDRTVYHENDLEGEVRLRISEKFNNLKKTGMFRVLYVLLLQIVGTFYLAVVWPKELYYLVMDVFSPGDKNGGTDGK